LSGQSADVEIAAREPESGRRRLSFGVALVVIALVGLAWRTAYALLMRDHPIFSDSLGYHFRAQDLADGNGFVLPARQVLGVPLENPPDASVPPGWSVFLSIPTRLGLRSVLSQQLVVCVIGVATIVMTGLAGRQAFGRRVGLIAAGIVTVYPNIWLYERELLSESLTMLLIATIIWLAYRFIPAPSTGLALALGVMVGLLALTRAEQIMLGILFVLPLLLTARSVPIGRRVAWLAMAGAACVLVIAPWTAYNWNRFEQPVLLSTGSGQALRAGNCERTYKGEFLGYTELEFVDTGNPAGCSIIDGELETDQTLADDQLRRAAFDFMRDNLDRVPVVVAVRIGRAFNIYRPFQQVHLEAERETPPPVLYAALFAYWALVPLAVLGAVVARRRKVRTYPLLVFFIVVLIPVGLTIGAVRYRSPAEIPLVLLAAVGADHLVRRRDSRTRVDPDRVGEPREPIEALA
jgi:4-amino-4-deoxy-L-arabinose transferase-like glycosyltransferase